MEVRSDRRFRFDVPVDELWARATSIDDYPRWWPWLRRFDAAGFRAGETWDCIVRPPLPYAVRFTVALDDVVPQERVAATIAGDVVGSADLSMRATDEGSEARLVSSLAPGNGFMRAIARLAHPLVRYGHDWVLDTGARQFNDRLPER